AANRFLHEAELMKVHVPVNKGDSHFQQKCEEVIPRANPWILYTIHYFGALVYSIEPNVQKGNAKKKRYEPCRTS
ncbi:MAG: hypothetical protein AB7V34_09955, partial [Brachymonas sp.]